MMARALTRDSLVAAVGLWARLRAGISAPLFRKYCISRHQDDSTEPAAAEVEVARELRQLPGGGGAGAGGGSGGWDSVAAKEYLEYRRALYGEITHKALLVDAVGTLLVPSQPVARVLTNSFPLKQLVHHQFTPR